MDVSSFVDTCNASFTTTCINNNITTNIIHNPTIKFTFYLLYIIIFILGLIGNIIVCYVVLRNKAMHSVTNFFILNLALSDILLCILAVPFTPLYTFLGEWVFGSLICHLVPFAQGTSIYISTLTLTSIAVDRFIVIIYPLYPRMQISTCIWIIFGIWIFSMLVTLPYGLYMDLKLYQGYYVCEENWPNCGEIQLIFGSFTTIMQFIIPFIVITYCYVNVSIRLNDRVRFKTRSTKNVLKQEADRERKRRTNRMLIAMVTVFSISWLPMNVVNILNDFYEPSTCWSFMHVSFFICHCLAMSSTCYNHILYAWLNENFRKEFKQVLPCLQLFLNDDGCEKSLIQRHGNGTETFQETLVPSGLNSTESPIKSLEPRAPIVKPSKDKESICLVDLSSNERI